MADIDENRHFDPKKAAMLEALTAHLGVVTEAIKDVGIARSTHYLWMTTDDQYKQAVDEVGDVLLDFAENKLFDLVKDKDTAATIFLLKTKGKKRGYIERSEVTGADGESIVLNFRNVGSTPAFETKKNGILTKAGVV